MKLSKRLQMVVNLVPETETVCDVGCDHGYVSIYLIRNHICRKVIATDLREGPLKRAEEHIRQCRLEDRIETRLSDGLDKIQKNEADTLVCAGMGGRLMESILRNGTEQVSGMKQLILQPQSEIPLLRDFLFRNGLYTADEDMVYEDGKFYTAMRVTGEKADETVRPEAIPEKLWQRYRIQYGPRLLKERNTELKHFLESEFRKKKRIQCRLEQEGNREESWERLKEVRDECRELETVLEYLCSDPGK